jgi:hypothetical protein
MKVIDIDTAPPLMAGSRQQKPSHAKRHAGSDGDTGTAAVPVSGTRAARSRTLTQNEPETRLLLAYSIVF